MPYYTKFKKGKVSVFLSLFSSVSTSFLYIILAVTSMDLDQDPQSVESNLSAVLLYCWKSREPLT